MATLSQDPAVPSVRRLLLIDFDWRDADWLPELFRSPGASVRLVVGDGPQDPGVRMAEMCDLPRTLDLADLTREIFDLALVGEHSSRRTQLESLLVALGTPCMTPEQYLRGPAATDTSIPGVDAPLALHAAAMEQSLAGSASGALEAMVESALPDLAESTPLAPRPIPQPAEPGRIARRLPLARGARAARRRAQVARFFHGRRHGRGAHGRSHADEPSGPGGPR
jgi:hypothetical protein